MNKVLLLISLLIFMGCGSQQTDTETEEADTVATTEETGMAVAANKVWETDTVLKTVESVLYDSDNDVIYASCINGAPDEKNGAGFIARVTLDGKVVDAEWVTGLNAPKGLGRSGNTLYVTDIDRIVAVNIESGEISDTYELEGAEFLNDIIVAEDGTVYFTDTNTNKIHTLSNGETTVWLESEAYQRPNGLWIEDDNLLVASFGDGRLSRVNMETKEVTSITDGLGGGDGLEAVGPGKYVVSDWNGQVFLVSEDGKKQTLIDTRDQEINAADIDYVPSEQLILVPTFFNNTVAAYKLNM